MHMILIPLLTSLLLIGSALVAHAASPNARPGAAPYASDANRAGPGGTYGGLKYTRPPMRGAGDVRDNDKKQPYYYRYYSDTDRSPGSCRRFAHRAIVTKNSNWWARYRACVN
ncbi:MAG: hypothetical protein WDN31_20155 [Hyphomicrobium sp.]